MEQNGSLIIFYSILEFKDKDERPTIRGVRFREEISLSFSNLNTSPTFYVQFFKPFDFKSN